MGSDRVPQHKRRLATDESDISDRQSSQKGKAEKKPLQEGGSSSQERMEKGNKEKSRNEH